MSVRLIFLFISLLSFTSCAHFPAGQAYLSAMERDDTSFFSPKIDFPVVAGDSGEDWIAEKENKGRRPSSLEDIREDRSSRALKSELKHLEGMQSDDSLEFYNTHKKALASTSQRIYFLSLPPEERKDYLFSRGILSEPKREVAAFEKVFSLRKNDVLIGMSKIDVLESMGKPMRVEIAGNPRNENERWLYRLNGASKYIYFESGEVQGWE